MSMQYNSPAVVTPTNQADSMYQWKQFMKSVGWTVPLSGTGTGGTTSASDLITGFTAAIGGMAQGLCWFVLRDPAGGRSLCVQHHSTTSTDYLWRVKYSAASGFTGGTTTQTPSAADEQYLIGGGTDASPTFGSLYENVSGTRRLLMMADNAAPYGFASVQYLVGGGTHPGHVMMMDPMLTGSFTSGGGTPDVDPVVLHFYGNDVTAMTSTGAGVISNFSFSSVLGPFSWFKKTFAGAGFVRVAALVLGAYNSATVVVAPTALATNPHSTNDVLLPVFWGRPSSLAAPYGFKGISTLMKMLTTSRNTGDTQTVSTTNDYVCLGHYAFPWNGSTPTV